MNVRKRTSCNFEGVGETYHLPIFAITCYHSWGISQDDEDAACDPELLRDLHSSIMDTSKATVSPLSLALPGPTSHL
jgi:hypothetical protein